MISMTKFRNASFNDHGYIFCLGKIKVDETGAITDSSKIGMGVKSVVKDDVGVYILTLMKPFTSLMHASVGVRGTLGSSGIATSEIAYEDHASTGSLTIVLKDAAGDAADFNTIGELSYELIVK